MALVKGSYEVGWKSCARISQRGVCNRNLFQKCGLFALVVSDYVPRSVYGKYLFGKVEEVQLWDVITDFIGFIRST